VAFDLPVPLTVRRRLARWIRIGRTPEMLPSEARYVVLANIIALLGVVFTLGFAPFLAITGSWIYPALQIIYALGYLPVSWLNRRGHRLAATTWLLLGARSGRARFAAGLLAGCATLTRTNAAFLLPCAALVLAFEPRRLRTLATYALGAALPLAAWAWFAARHGGLPADRNYLNVAWELYGQGVPWDRFETTTGARFHSMLDVLRFDPLRAAAHVARNLVTQRADDLRELTTPWLGALALPGLIVLARRERARGWLLHGAACALVLAPVFYNARFGLYLLPLELAATGATLAWIAARVSVRRAVGALAAVLLAGALVTGIAETVGHLRDARESLRFLNCLRRLRHERHAEAQDEHFTEQDFSQSLHTAYDFEETNATPPLASRSIKRTIAQKIWEFLRIRSMNVTVNPKFRSNGY